MEVPSDVLNDAHNRGCSTFDESEDGCGFPCDCKLGAFLAHANREAFHKAAIAQAGRHAQQHPELIDDYSDADGGL